ncbi:MAG: hypothetical protein QM739_18495 [Propionivibrio sp.]
MIVFNCSQAFAEFIEPKKAGPAPLVCEAPSPHPSEDGPHLIDVDGEPARYVQQWLVHFLRIQRKPCAVAMDIDTRYAMVFPHIRKGDPEGFLNAFATRLMNEMVHAASSVEMIADFEAMLACFIEINQRFLFVRRSERSTQSHLKEAIWDFEHDCHDNGRVPETHEECAVIDARINRTPRRTKERKDGFFADEEMLCAWLRTYGGLTPSGEPMVRARWRDNLRHERRIPEIDGKRKV